MLGHSGVILMIDVRYPPAMEIIQWWFNSRITILAPTHKAEPCTDQRNDSDETSKAYQSGKFRKVNKWVVRFELLRTLTNEWHMIDIWSITELMRGGGLSYGNTEAFLSLSSSLRPPPSFPHPTHTSPIFQLSSWNDWGDLRFHDWEQRLCISYRCLSKDMAVTSSDYCLHETFKFSIIFTRLI